MSSGQAGAPGAFAYIQARPELPRAPSAVRNASRVEVHLARHWHRPGAKMSVRTTCDRQALPFIRSPQFPLNPARGAVRVRPIGRHRHWRARWRGTGPWPGPPSTMRPRSSACAPGPIQNPKPRAIQISFLFYSVGVAANSPSCTSHQGARLRSTSVPRGNWVIVPLLIDRLSLSLLEVSQSSSGQSEIDASTSFKYSISAFLRLYQYFLPSYFIMALCRECPHPVFIDIWKGRNQ